MNKRVESKITKPALVHFTHQAKHTNCNANQISLPGSQGVNEMREKRWTNKLMNEMSEIDMLKQLLNGDTSKC